MAEVDGNRTRRRRITTTTRFEGGGAHQALGHLPGAAEPTAYGDEPVGAYASTALGAPV